MKKFFLAALLAFPLLAEAQYPTKPVRGVVAFGTGGTTDVTARIVAAAMSQSLGQTVVIDNKPGADGIIAGSDVVKSAPDGYTIWFATYTQISALPSLRRNVPFDPIGDFTSVIWIGNIPLVLVIHPSIPAHSVKELVAVARARPGMLVFASGGVGSGGHLSGELFKYLTKTDILHVPYKGNSVALVDVLGGHVSMMFDTITTSLPHVQRGKLRLLAVTTAERSSLVPQTPTVAESGLPGFDTSAWYGTLGPARMPREFVERLNAELNKAFNDPAFRDQFAVQGVRFIGGPPERLEQHMRSELKRWGSVFAATGIKPQ